MAKVAVDGIVKGRIDDGLAILLGVHEEDELEDAKALAEKIVNLRIFRDEEGKLNRSVLETGGKALVVSQFTLLADSRKGRRPSYSEAARPEKAIPLYEAFIGEVRKAGLKVECGEFGKDMQIELINDGPVTIILDSWDLVGSKKRGKETI
jgi:D-aminoacyl-tRNA deacylase